jgi:hypothetical protein
MSSLDVVLRQSSGQYNSARLELLAAEMRYAWERTEPAQLRKWAADTGHDFVQFGWNRVSKTGNAVKRVLGVAIGESVDFIHAWQDDRLLPHLECRYSAWSNATSKAYCATAETLSLVRQQLTEHPAEAGSRLLTMMLASVVVSGGADADGGAPDLDLMFGIGAHRSILSHSIIMGTTLETAISATFRLIQVIYQNLPSEHDRFWDAAIVGVEDVLQQIKIGSSIGMAYHLFVDGTIQEAAYKDLPISLPMEFHEGILVANAAAEAVNAADLSSRPNVQLTPSGAASKAYGLRHGPQNAETVEVIETGPLHSRCRSFQSRKEAEHFCRFLKEENASHVKVFQEQVFRVEYTLAAHEPPWGRRNGLRYPAEERKFIRRHYFLWVPLENIARAIERKESSLQYWLNKEKLYFTSMREDYRPGTLPQEDAGLLFDDISAGYISRHSAALIQKIGVLTGPLPTLNINGELSLTAFTPEQQMQIEHFACTYSRTDAAARLALLQCSYEKSFVQARQANDMCFALLALKKLEDPSPLMKRARTVMIHYMRQEFLTLFPRFLEDWIRVAKQRKSDFSYGVDDEESRIAKGQRLACALRACMAREPETWDKRISEIYKFLSRIFVTTYAGPFSSPLQSWMYADAFRHAAARLVHDCGESDFPINDETLFWKHVALASQASVRAGEYLPQVDEIMGLLQQALPFDEEEASHIREARLAATSGTLQFNLT